jgi:hypothetical protein
MGTINKTLISQPSSVNYSVADAQFSNISLSVLYDGMQLGEVWGIHFVNITTSYIRNIALNIKGQCVNNTFTGCSFHTAGQGKFGVVIDGDLYASGQKRRPEGNNFIGGMYGYATTGVAIEDALATYFTNVTIDLNEIGVTILQGDYVTFTDCWIHASTWNPVSFRDLATTVHGGQATFKGCKFIAGTATQNSVFVGLRQNGIILDGCYVDNTINFGGANAGTVKDCIFVTPETTEPSITIQPLSNVNTTNNTFKASGNAVIVQRF